jgi:CheY-like chemotaxis protein
MAIKILYVEDNPMSAEIVRRLLTRSGYEVLEAANGFAALEITLNERPDLILMDIHLPGMTGTETAARIKAYPELARIPIIALTANAMHGDRQRFLSSGFEDYLSKPVSKTELRNLIAQILGSSVG